MKKSIFIFILFIIPCAVLGYWGYTTYIAEKPAYVVSIQETGTNENYTTYTITYSDGNTSNFQVKNGKDGVDGENGKDGKDAEKITVQDIYNAYVEENGNSALSFNEFLQHYLQLEVEDTKINDAVNKALMSAVSIYAYNTGSSMLHMGSGVIYKMYDEVSYIITNYHVLYNEESSTNVSNEIYILQYGVNSKSDRITCEYVGGSLTYDIALIKCNTSELLAKNEYACEIEVASGYYVSDTAIAIGNPEGDGISVTKGIISVDSENIEMTAVDEKTKLTHRVMRIDTSVNGGNSGGGLFNDKGELIGIVSAKFVWSSNETPIDNISYAIPYDKVMFIVSNLLHNYGNGSNGSVSVNKLTIGLTVTTTNSKCVFNNNKLTIVENTVVHEVSDNSISSTVGFEVGDILKSVKINNVTYNITRFYQLSDLLISVQVGDKIEFIIDRNGERTLTLDSAPASSFTTVA